MVVVLTDFVLPVESLILMLNTTCPCACVFAVNIVSSALQEVLSAAGAVKFVMVAAPFPMVTVGLLMASLLVKFNVILSPTFALDVLLLFETMATVVKAGVIVSIITLLPFVVVVTSEAAILVELLAILLMAKVAVPVVLEVLNVTSAFQEVLPDRFVTVAEVPAIVAVGVLMASLVVKFTVTLLPNLALVVMALSDTMVTVFTVGRTCTLATPAWSVVK